MFGLLFLLVSASAGADATDNALALIYVEQVNELIAGERFQLARESAEHALAFSRTISDTHYAMGRVLWYQNADVETAASYLEKALDIDDFKATRRSDCVRYVSHCYYKTKQYERYIELAKTAGVQLYGDPRYAYGLAFSYYKLDKPLQMNTVCKSALSREPYSLRFVALQYMAGIVDADYLLRFCVLAREKNMLDHDALYIVIINMNEVPQRAALISMYRQHDEAVGSVLEKSFAGSSGPEAAREEAMTEEDMTDEDMPLLAENGGIMHPGTTESEPAEISFPDGVYDLRLLSMYAEFPVFRQDAASGEYRLELPSGRYVLDENMDGYNETTVDVNEESVQISVDRNQDNKPERIVTVHGSTVTKVWSHFENGGSHDDYVVTYDVYPYVSTVKHRRDSLETVYSLEPLRYSYQVYNEGFSAEKITLSDLHGNLRSAWDSPRPGPELVYQKKLLRIQDTVVLFMELYNDGIREYGIYDRDENGLFDEKIYYLNGDDFYRKERDLDENGYFEHVELYDGEQPGTIMIDTDQDGIMDFTQNIPETK